MPTAKGLIPFLLLDMLFQNSKRFGSTLSATTENNWLLVTAEIAGLADPIFDAEGWVAPGLDVNKKRTQNEELLTMYIESVAGEKSAEEARAIWPFPVKAGV